MEKPEELRWWFLSSGNLRKIDLDNWKFKQHQSYYRLYSFSSLTAEARGLQDWNMVSAQDSKSEKSNCFYLGAPETILW